MLVGCCWPLLDGCCLMAAASRLLAAANQLLLLGAHQLLAAGYCPPAAAWGQWAVGLLRQTAALQGAAGSGSLTVHSSKHYRTAGGRGHGAGGLRHYTAALRCGVVWGGVVWGGVGWCGVVWGGVGWGGVGWGGVGWCGVGGGGGGGAPAAVPRTVSLGVVPRGPNAGSAEGVLRLTSARARRILSHT